MRLNGGLLSSGTSEWVTLRQAWRKWNESCQLDDKIDWEDYYDKHKK
jgi:hypothetical protein